MELQVEDLSLQGIDAPEIHPAALVTVNVKVPVGIPVIVLLVPVPEVLTPPGVLVITQLPVGGKLFNTILPVAEVHVGCVIVPIVGGVGVTGCGLIRTSAEGNDVHSREPYVTIKL